MTDLVGKQLGNYRLIRVLGQGAFAVVYLGQHLHLERLAAIKVLRVQMEPRTHEAFRQEARTIAQLRHPHIVGVHDFGFENQTPYLVMEHMPNGTLRSRYPHGTRLPFEQIVTYMKQIASALDYAHQRHVVHQDVKPENLLLGLNDEIVLSDFGIALLQRTLDTLPMQHSAGTPIYMAPEQIEHKPCAASDQYALAVMVYEWLCGELPFHGSLYQVLGQHLHKTPPSLCTRLKDLPPDAESAIFKALAKEPEQRFACVSDFATAFADAFSVTQMRVLSGSLEYEEKGLTFFPRTRSTALPVPSLSTQQKDSIGTGLAPEPLPQRYARTAQAHMNRQRLLQRVRLFWIIDVFERSLHGAALLTLGLKAQPNAVANPWRLVIQESESTTTPLPVGTRVTAVYDEAGGELLMLGEPGSGKTTLLLELARDLLYRAEQDQNHPIPVVFNLSSWVRKRQPLAAWLVEELQEKYHVPREIGSNWVNGDQILPLLDGLDEVDASSRAACMQAVNVYHQTHSLVPLVVCSRIKEYMSQESRLSLHRAVTIQPLTLEQVDEYFASIGEPVASLRLVFQHDPVLQELAKTPLMLTILIMVYRDSSEDEIVGDVPIEVRKSQIFATYTQRMLGRRRTEPRFSEQETVGWLSWLARQMKQRSQTQFLLERLQRDWLSNWQPYRLCLSLAIGAISLLILVPVNGTIFGNFLAGTLVALLDAAIAILFVWLSTRDVRRSRPLSDKRKGQSPMLEQGNEENLRSPPVSSGRDTSHCPQVSSGFVPRGRTWFMKFLQWKVAFACLAGVLDGLLVESLIGTFYACVHGIFYCAFYIVLDNVGSHIQPAEVLNWSWTSVWRNAVRSVLEGMGIGFLLGLSNAVLYSSTPSTFLTTLAFGLSLGFALGLAIMLMRGFSSNVLNDVQKTIRPNQGIWNSFSNSMRLGLCTGLVVGFVIFLYYSLVAYNILRVGYAAQLPPNSGLIYGASDALAIAYLYWLKSGGFACVQHLVLRVLLWRAKCIPWRYARFLDYAHERILLRKVGGGYIFIHQLLLEYFASLETAEDSDRLARVGIWDRRDVGLSPSAPTP